MQYTKKAVTIEAVLWDGEKISEVTPWISKALNTKWGEGSIMRTGNKVDIFTLEGIVTANPGDYIIQGVNGELYPCKPEIFEKTYTAGTPAPSKLEEFRKFQEEIGYKQGDINPIALLGLFGEAGEVLNEVFLIDNSSDAIKAEDIKIEAVKVAANIDLLKKAIRNATSHDMRIKSRLTLDLFDQELSDCFYYLHALCINRGLTIEGLIRLSMDKINKLKEQKVQTEKVESETKWIRFIDEKPGILKKIVARHITTPHIIGEAHFFDPSSPNTRRANLSEFEWRYVAQTENV